MRSTDIQTWLNVVGRTCQCCAQGKDKQRRAGKQRCCAIGNCCNGVPSATSIVGLRRILRSILGCAIDADLITQDVAKRTKLPTVRKPRRTSWAIAEARQFLEYASVEDELFYAAYVLLLVLGLRKGEILGLQWGQIDLEAAELTPNFQVQRVGTQLLRREVKTETSEQPFPLPDICLAALLRHRAALETAGRPTGEDNYLIFTITGMPVVPRNFNRYWNRVCFGAGVRRITVRCARRTCATLLRGLNVHPNIVQRILRHAQWRSRWRSTPMRPATLGALCDVSGRR